MILLNNKDRAEAVLELIIQWLKIITSLCWSFHLLEQPVVLRMLGDFPLQWL